MSDHTEITEAAIRSMLTARADRATRSPFDPAAIADAAGPRVRRHSPGSPFIGRISLAASGVAAVVAVAVLVGSSLLEKPGASQEPTGSGSAISSSGSASSATSPSATPPSEAIRILSPAEAGELIRSQSDARSGSLFVVKGQLVAGETVVTHCASGPCGSTLLADAGGGFVVRPVGDIGPGPWSASGPGHLSGTFVLRLSEAVDNHLRIVDFIGALTTPPNGGPAWFVQDLLEGSVSQEGAYAAVRGWLVRGGMKPCPSDPHNLTVAYGCPTDDYLTEDEFQPLQPDGSTLRPPAAIDLSSRSYDQWAPDPAAGGPGGHGGQPRPGTYLLWLISDGCGPKADCASPPPRWRIVGRFDPIPPLASEPSLPTTPAPSGDQAIVWTVSEVAAAESQDPFVFADGRLLAVRGWLVATPALRCHSQPVPSGVPSWGCDEVDWLTEDPFQPWTSDGSDGSVRAPSVGLRVQNGAYATFAPRQAIAPGGGLVPELATYLIRGSVDDGCDTLPAPSDSTPCTGHPVVVRWEIVGLQPGTLISPPIILPSLKPGETPLPGTDGSGDTPCMPVGQPCG